MGLGLQIASGGEPADVGEHRAVCASAEAKALGFLRLTDGC